MFLLMSVLNSLQNTSAPIMEDKFGERRPMLGVNPLGLLRIDGRFHFGGRRVPAVQSALHSTISYVPHPVSQRYICVLLAQ